MLKDNLKTLRKKNGLSQDELSVKLHVVRQTISKWESGLSVPDAEMLINISKEFDTPVSELLGENIKEKEANDLKVISKKLEVINEQLLNIQKDKRKKQIKFLIIIDIVLVALFIILALLGSPYLNWNYSITEWAIIGTIWHVFEWIYFKISPLIIVALTVIIIIMSKKNN